MLEERGASCHVRASVNGLLVYAYSMDGASINNQEWARRKAKLCERYSMSSLRVACRLEAEGKSLESCGMDKADYGLSGGSFPLLLSSGLCVGSITVSGLKGEEDHQIVADAIAAELGVQIPSVLA